jgi:hypothetical protein
VISTRSILSAARASSTIRRIVFTQAGAGVINIDNSPKGVGMEKVLDGKFLQLLAQKKKSNIFSSVLSCFSYILAFLWF